MIHLDIFSGIGGFAIAAQATGHTTIGFSEIDPYASKILKRHWPNTKNLGDIRNVTSKSVQQLCREKNTPSRIRLLTGGFPCQPFSQIGKQQGAADDRSLWPEMFRVINETKPTWVIGENVPGIIGMELDNVLSDLEAIGYTAWPFVIPACAVDARIRRDRVWIMARAKCAGLEGYTWNVSYRDKPGWNNSKAYRPTCPRRVLLGGWREVVYAAECDTEGDGFCPCGFDYSDECTQPGPTQDGYEYKEQDGILYGRPEQLPPKWADEQKWFAESGMGRMVNGLPNRAHRIKALGNAIVPPLAEALIRMTIDFDDCPSV